MPPFFRSAKIRSKSRWPRTSCSALDHLDHARHGQAVHAGGYVDIVALTVDARLAFGGLFLRRKPDKADSLKVFLLAHFVLQFVAWMDCNVSHMSLQRS